jgi:hypothetical protein
MKTRPGILTLAAIATGLACPAVAQLDYGIVIHMSEPDYAQLCDLFDDATFTCADVRPEGTASTTWAWFAVYGYENCPGWSSPAIGAVQFGVEFDLGVSVMAFTLCTGGSLIGTGGPYLPNWPDESGCAAAITWAGGAYDSPGEENFAKIGYFSLVSGSFGRMLVAEDPRIDAVVLADANALVFELPVEGYSSADVRGDLADFDGFAACPPPPTPTEITSWGRIKALY